MYIQWERDAECFEFITNIKFVWHLLSIRDPAYYTWSGHVTITHNRCRFRLKCFQIHCSDGGLCQVNAETTNPCHHQYIYILLLLTMTVEVFASQEPFGIKCKPIKMVITKLALWCLRCLYRRHLFAILCKGVRSYWLTRHHWNHRSPAYCFPADAAYEHTKTEKLLANRNMQQKPRFVWIQCWVSRRALNFFFF